MKMERMQYKTYDAAIGEIRDDDVDVYINGNTKITVLWSGDDTCGDAIRRALLKPNHFITIALVVGVVAVCIAIF